MTNKLYEWLSQDFANLAMRKQEVNNAQERKQQRHEQYNKYFDEYVASPVTRYAIVPKADEQLLAMRVGNKLFQNRKKMSLENILHIKLRQNFTFFCLYLIANLSRLRLVFSCSFSNRAGGFSWS